MNNCFQILSLDGGGLRGIFTASFLAAIEEHTGKPIVDSFDLIAGTSTGGIIALGLGLGLRPKEILRFYKEKGPKIFPKKNRLSGTIRNMKWFFHRKYQAEQLKEALTEIFGDKLLCQSKKRLLIPSFDSVRGDLYIYKTPHHVNLRCDYKVLAREVALSTASAPTYFPAFINDVGIRLIDGGIWANNPSMVALTEAFGYLAQPQGRINMLSIGTTREAMSSERAHIHGGIWRWGKKYFEFMMHSQSLSAENQAFHILGEARFMRINPMVPRKYALDNLAEELEGIGQTEARKQINTILKMFLDHTAGTYEPIYTINIHDEGHNGGKVYDAK